ncbi:PKD-like domain-containing protein [Algoriphagus namhaensis]|uniref:PKD-like domain-containing protein n=1 Tax=Algoriphagus namhaensis TaxID=915353 RepID=A0ABV8AMF6_9BACT
MKVRFNPFFLILFCLSIWALDSYAQTQIITTPDPAIRKFVVPSGVNSITVEVWGAGGSGGTRQGSNGAAAGGGGGAYSRSVFTVSAGQEIDYYVGFGSLTTAPGEDTWFFNPTTLMAKGGNSPAINATTGAAGGAKADGYGDVRNSGGNGGNVVSGNGGGGGSSAGSFADGVNAIGRPGATAPFGGGNGGAGKQSGNGQGGQGRGDDGTAPGGGGGGSVRNNASGTEIVGGYGGNGQIRISYIQLTSAIGTDNQSVCEGDPIIETTYTVPLGSSMTFSNSPPGLSPSFDTTTGTVTYSGTPTADGTYEIEALTPYGITLTRNGTVTIIPLPEVDDLFTTICSEDSFSLIPVDGIDGVIPAGTTYVWDAPSVTGGITGGAAGSGSAITGALTNPTNTVQFATYTVTPTANGCVGDDFPVTVTVSPKATIDDLTIETCNGDTFNITPVQGANGIVPAGTTYNWTPQSIPAGITGAASGSGTSITGTLTNTTNAPLVAVYTVTPTSGSCPGDDFSVSVTVDPEPNITDISQSVCSGESFTVDPQNGTNGVIPSGTTYSWIVSSVTGGVTGATSGSGSTITGTLTNPTSASQTVEYTVTPSSVTCGGSDFTVTITVSPEPDITSMTDTVCSEESFTVTPVNGINGIVPDGTTYIWGVPSVTGGMTGGAAGSGNAITGTLTNPTNTAQTATYIVTPSSAGCTGDTFEVTVTVNPEPSINDLTDAICTGATFNITPVQGADGIVPAGTTYNWTPQSIPAGITGAASGSGTSITGTLANTTNAPLVAVYTVTPTSGSCPGDDFSVSVTVDPEPNITDISQSVCSGESFTVDPQNGTNGVIPSGTTYSWIVASVTGGVTGATSGSGSTITGTLTNPTNASQTVEYTVTPSSATCGGSDFTVTITVSPEPDITAMIETVCSEESFTVTPVNGINGIVPAGTTYTWGVPSVTGGMTGGAAGSGNAITGALTNPTNSSQTATYIVTPSSGGCTGNTFEVTVTVDPEPSINDLTNEICTGGTFNITPSQGGDGIVPAGTTYNWTPQSIPAGITGASSGSGTSITGTLTNTTNAPLVAVYTVTPTSGSCAGDDFSLSVTVNPITAITTQPDPSDYVECFGDGFDTPLTVNAVGGQLTYQWYAKPDNSDIATNPGTPVSGATSSSFLPPSTPEGINYYYVVVTGFCGTVVSDLSGQYRVNPPETVIDTHPSTDDETTCQGGTFPQLTVLASGEGTISYQWYSNTSPSNTGGTLIPGATDPDFTPPSTTVGTLYYYATGSSNCGTVPTDVSGAFTVTPLTEITDEDLAGQTICDGDSFSSISVTADGTGTLTYQWYQNDQNSTTIGNITAIGPNSNTFTPPATLGTYYYFVVVSSDCGPDDTSSVSGQFTVNPIPTVTNTDLDQTICSGGSTSEVIFTSGVAGTAFDWTATATAGVSGFTASGSGPIPIETISTTGTTQGSVTYEIIPSANGCTGPSINYTVFVDPLPTVTNSSLTQEVCSGGSTTEVILTSDVSGTTFDWTATATAGVSGFTASGSGPIPVQTISTTESSPGTVTYEITPSANSCDGPIATYTVVVNPIPTVTNASLTQTICSGQNTTEVNLTSDVSGTAFTWTATATSGVSGFAANGSGPIPVQSITTSESTPGTVTYEITPSANGCNGPIATYTVVVNPVPTVTNTSLTQTICSGGSTTQVDLTSDVSGVIFNWTASASSTDISGFSASGSGPIPVETISNSGTTQGTVTYTIIPVANGCSGTNTDYVVRVDPLPFPTFTSSPPAQVCAEIDPVTYTTQPGQSNYTWTIPGTPGSDYTITSGGTGANSNSVTLLWQSAGTKTVTVSYTNSSNGCQAVTSATSTTLVEPLATVGDTSVPFPSVCISSPVLNPFTQPTMGVIGIGTPTGLPPGVNANFNPSTGEIEFSGNVSGATPGLYSYSIPLTGNCTNGLTATGTIDVTPNYQLTSISAVSATFSGGSARIIINGNPADLPNGEYVVTYELDDGTPPPVTATSAPFSVTNGRGVFPTIPLTDLTVDVYTIEILSIQKTTDVCIVPINANNTALFSLCGANYDQDGTFYVPAGIFEITITATGGGTSGATDLITIPVTPGEPLGVFIGEGGATGTGRDTYVTRDPTQTDLQSTSLIYVQGQGGPGANGEVIISYTCPDPNSADCIEVIDDGAKTGTTVIRFNCDDTWEIPEGLVEFSVYAIGGGGGGGMGPTAGGGGAGGFTSTTVTSTNPSGIAGGNSININIGEGGTGATTVNVKGNSGNNTTVTGTIPDQSGNISINLNAQGGGGGGSFNNLDGLSGASGGGGAYSDQTNDTAGQGGSGIAGQGHSGGRGGRGNQPNHARGGGGGGGVGEVGENGSGSGVGQSRAGDGGDGSSFALSVTSFGYGAGGGGIGFNFNGQADREGLGGEVDGVILGGTASNSGVGGDGTIYTGSGGGAGRLGGGAGGQGVVFIVYENFRILPVEYLYFEAEYNRNLRAGDLSWATAKEWENDRFEIQRSVNDTRNWEIIGEHKGAGYSDEVTVYDYRDTRLPVAGGNIFYRLKQFDFDGDTSYSETRAIQVEPLPGVTRWRVYPNPTTGDPFNIELLDAAFYGDEEITVRVIAPTGQFETFDKQNLATIGREVSQYFINRAAGVYTIEISWGIYREYHKVILRR